MNPTDKSVGTQVLQTGKSSCFNSDTLCIRVGMSICRVDLFVHVLKYLSVMYLCVWGVCVWVGGVCVCVCVCVRVCVCDGYGVVGVMMYIDVC